MDLKKKIGIRSKDWLFDGPISSLTCDASLKQEQSSQWTSSPKLTSGESIVKP